jgi:tRNA U34 5-methylaminomethyl-2-thiouridine-forming methyltransferase MnmC
MKSELILTQDGSHTLFVPEIDECYHSTFGAMGESMLIFIQSGFNSCEKDNISVLEVGFGTGLNAFLTLLEAENRQKEVFYTAFELFPLAVEKAEQLNYPEMFSLDKRFFFEKLHTSAWGEEVPLTPFFKLLKINADFIVSSLPSVYDLIYFDAFSPEKQPEMWTQEIFQKIFDHCNENAILTTYCVKGNIRRSLQKTGFIVEKLPGPPGKREFLRAVKPSNSEFTEK